MTSAEASAAQRVASRSGYPTGHVFDMSAESESCFVVLDGVVGVGEGLLKAGDTFTNSFRFATDVAKLAIKPIRVEASCVLLCIDVSKIPEKLNCAVDPARFAALEKQRLQRRAARQAEEAQKKAETQQGYLAQVQAEIRVQQAEFNRLAKLLGTNEGFARLASANFRMSVKNIVTANRIKGSRQVSLTAADSDVEAVQSELFRLRAAVANLTGKVRRNQAMISNMRTLVCLTLPPASQVAWRLVKGRDRSLSPSFMTQIEKVLCSAPICNAILLYVARAQFGVPD